MRFSRIEHDRFRRSRDAERLGARAVEVLDERELDLDTSPPASPSSMSVSSSAALTATNCTSLPRYSFSSRLQHRQIPLRDRAARVRRTPARQAFFAAEVVERSRQRADVGELQLADACRRSSAAPRRKPKSMPEREPREPRRVATDTWRRPRRDEVKEPPLSYPLHGDAPPNPDRQSSH